MEMWEKVPGLVILLEDQVYETKRQRIQHTTVIVNFNLLKTWRYSVPRPMQYAADKSFRKAGLAQHFLTSATIET